MGNVFRIQRDGPVLAQGDLVLATEDGTVLRRLQQAAFCRCGKSGHAPLCDGTHRKVGFADGPDAGGKVRVDPLPEGAPEDGPVTIVLKATGSLRLVGPLTVVDADGREHAGGRASICRCGASRTKPWCDNTHREIGFEVEVKIPP